MTSDAELTGKREEPSKLAIFASHPIQYQAPWFRELSALGELDLRVYFTQMPGAEQQGVGFDTPFVWDLPLLDGYRWEQLPSARSNPRLDRFFGNPLHWPARVIGDWSPDVAIVTGWQNVGLVQTFLACKRMGIPCVVRGESNSLKQRSWLVHAAHRSLLRRFDAFLAIGQANRDFYLTNGVEPERIFDCPYFVDNERFALDAASHAVKREELRHRWGVSAEEICFLFAGKLAPKKRVLDLIEACRLARESGSSIRLLVVGDGAQIDDAQQAVARHSLPVTFAGFLNQSEIAKAYVACDGLVLPSDYGETWGLVVNEAMACGRPAIVSDRVGCGLDLVEEGFTGFTFPFGDVEALASILVGAASDPQRLRKLGDQARQRVLKKYSVDKAVEGTLEAVSFATSRLHEVAGD